MARIGYRAWKLEYEEGKVIEVGGVRIETSPSFTFGPIGYSTGKPWVLGEVTESVCQKGRVDHPKIGCTCGLHAWYDIGVVHPGVQQVIGAVQCWGRTVYVEDEGMRFQKGRILCVLEPSPEAYILPPPPSIPMKLVDNLHSMAISELTLSQFKEYVGKLYRMTPSLPARLHFRMPGESEMEVLYAKVLKRKDTIAEMERKYTEELSSYNTHLSSFTEDMQSKFREYVPFPVFKTKGEVVEYASMFGDVGIK